MTKLDPNKLAVMVMLIALVLISAVFGYRLEIRAIGLTFETGSPGPTSYHNANTPQARSGAPTTAVPG